MASAQTSITNGNCRAAFKYAFNDKMMTIAPATAINFYDRSEGKAMHWFWDFGNGNTSNEQNPMFIFYHPISGISVKMNPYRTVSLTVLTEDSCKSFYSETINILDGSIYTQPACKARFKYYQTAYDSINRTTSFQLTNLSEGDSLKYSWQFDNGKTSTEKEPMVTFDLSRPERKVCLTVKAITPDGTYVTGTFVFNSNGTVTEAPLNWWVTGYGSNQFVRYDVNNKDFTVEWHLCDGTFVKKDSIPLNLINCGGNASNMVLKDASGNVVYAENITLKTSLTAINPDVVAPSVKLFPNPVTDVLNIQYSGTRLNEMQLEICDVAGRRISLQKFYDVEPGQQISLNVNSLRKGIYLCKMLSDKQIIRIEKFSK